MHKYLDKLHATIRSDKLFNEHGSTNNNVSKTATTATTETITTTTTTTTTVGEMEEHVFDIFIYNKCHPAIFHYFDSTGFDTMNKSLHDRLDSLQQFVNPSHLELHCFSTNDDWKQALSQPIRHLQSLERQYSPKQMLSCILAIYRSINEVLSTAMNQMSSSTSTSPTSTSTSPTSTSTSSTSSTTTTPKKTEKLPSADDVLPTLILTTIHVNPSKILSILRFIECFATDDEMRGEDAYAYTNLYSAVEFIRELDLTVLTSNNIEDNDDDDDEHGNKNQPSLFISKQDLRHHLEKYKKQQQQQQEEEKRLKQESAKSKKNTSANKEKETKTIDMDFPTPKSIHLPIGEVRAARLRGENMMKWAQSWYESHSAMYDGTTPTSTSPMEQKTFPSPPTTTTTTTTTSTHPNLQNFTRSYNYLAIEPNDIRISDISPLLDEYKSLVYATETLLTERTNIIQDQYKKMVLNRRKDLERDAEEVNAFGKSVIRN